MDGSWCGRNELMLMLMMSTSCFDRFRGLGRVVDTSDTRLRLVEDRMI